MMSIGDRKILVPAIICYAIPFVTVLLNFTTTVFRVDKVRYTPGTCFLHFALFFSWRQIVDVKRTTTKFFMLCLPWSG